jgi:hypothetical protein
VRAIRIVIAIALVLVALPLAYLGLFLILYTGDSATPADTYVDLAGREIDADVVGVAVVAVGVALLVAGFVLVRRR